MLIIERAAGLKKMEEREKSIPGYGSGILHRIAVLMLVLSLCIGMTSEAQAKSKKSASVSTYTAHYANGVTRTYKKYRQNKDKYGKYYEEGAKRHCVLTAVSIAASGFGVNYPPCSIHSAKSTNPYGEKYALKKLHLMYHNHQVHTLYLATQILNDMGISSRYVPVYKKDRAEKEITAHLKSGKPVIILTKNATWKGIRIAKWRHALVLVNVRSDGKVKYINPNAANNGSARGNKRKGIYLTVRQFLDHFMFSSTGKYAKAYNPSKCGGYILVG